MTLKRNLSYYCVVLFNTAWLLSSCSSPEQDGINTANKLNKCNASYLEDVQQAETSFTADFNRSDYQTRAEAKQAYMDVMKEANSKYQQAIADFDKQEAEMARKYARDFNKQTKYENAFDNSIDEALDNKVMMVSQATEIPESVMAKVKTIVPTEPDYHQVQEDLVGCQLTEGYEKEECWFHEDYRWKIERGEIRDFEIEEVLRNDDKKYVFIATMRLESKLNAFNARVKVSYWLPDAEDWKLEFVNSLGVTIVKTHEYDDCVSYEIKDDGWGGVDALFITNKTELELGVGVEVVADGRRKRYAVRVSPNRQSQVGGLFGGGNVTSYEVEFVERF